MNSAMIAALASAASIRKDEASLLCVQSQEKMHREL
jgi:hypothetical protein